MTIEPKGDIRIVLVDDHRLFREGVRVILSVERDLRVVAEGGAGEAVGMVAEHHPDILLLGVQRPGSAPVMTIRQVTRVSPATQVVILSTHSDNDLILSLVTAGAAAYLSKNIGGQELRSELRLAACNSRMFTVRVPRARMAGPQVPVRPLVALTDRETEILRLVSQAMTNSQIATKLFVSEATVKRHLTNVFTKFKARSRLDAVNRAFALGLLDGHEGRAGIG